MHKGKELTVAPFNSSSNPLLSIESTQSKYIQSYLIGVDAKTILIEHNYFDRDYLDEFAVFYSKSARGYDNICQRIHFFSSVFDKDLFKLALGDSPEAIETLQSTYLGFTILRPIRQSPFARTVLAWYPQPKDGSIRINNPSRIYTCTIAGIKLQVHGLAWQQQDTGVSACATIGIWTMLHSSAFDDHHSIPTTAAITQAAHEKASLGDRVFPSQGLKNYQILEAIKAQNLTPIVSTGDLPRPGQFPLFSTGKFASTCSAFVRSGYPVLVIGRYVHIQCDIGHMVCVVGFKESNRYEIALGDYKPMNEKAEYFYIHDDNLGPNIRCKLINENINGHNASVLVTDPPPYVPDDVKQPKEQFKFLPEYLIIAVHEELRISADNFYNTASSKTAQVINLLNQAYIELGEALPKYVFSARFLTLREYLSVELPRLCGDRTDLLTKVRLGLSETAPPMSLHLGLIRIAMLEEDRQDPIIDIICDTTDSDRNQSVFAHILFNEDLSNLLLNKVHPAIVEEVLGTRITAHD